MVDKYLKPINMEHLAKTFIENKVSGLVLLGLEVSGLLLQLVQCMWYGLTICRVSVVWFGYALGENFTGIGSASEFIHPQGVANWPSPQRSVQLQHAAAVLGIG